LQADYRGSFLLYQELTDLNAFDQRANADIRHRLTRNLTLFARNGISRSPSTDEIELPGILFRRQGVLLEDFRAGVDTRFGPRTSLMTAYTFQWVDFEQGSLPVETALSQGGVSHGAIATLQHALSHRLSIGADFDMRHALLNDDRVFDTRNAMGTVDWRISERLVVSGGAGYSWLATDQEDQRQAAPAFRGDISGSGPRFGWNAGYRRAFLPSFGFGGTFQNEELYGNVLAPLGRRLDLSGGLSVRMNEPLVPTDRRLRSTWARASVSYLANRWMRIEGFYALALQDSQRPGGKVDRMRLGVQVVTSKRMRLR
jgi:hypothetical protein